MANLNTQIPQTQMKEIQDKINEELLCLKSLYETIIINHYNKDVSYLFDYLKKIENNARRFASPKLSSDFVKYLQDLNYLVDHLSLLNQALLQPTDPAPRDKLVQRSQEMISNHTDSPRLKAIGIACVAIGITLSILAVALACSGVLTIPGLILLSIGTLPVYALISSGVGLFAKSNRNRLSNEELKIAAYTQDYITGCKREHERRKLVLTFY